MLRVQKKTAEAESAFLRAQKEDPSNPNTYMNLSILYRELGNHEQARQMRSIGRGLMKENEASRFMETLKKNGT